MLTSLTDWLERTVCKPHRERKYFHFLKFMCACECVSRSFENIHCVSCGWTPEPGSHNRLGSRVLSKQELMSISGPDHWSFWQPHAVTLVHRFKHATGIQEANGRKPLVLLTGSLTLTRKRPHGKLITSLKLLKPKRPKGPPTHNCGLQGRRLFHAGVGGMGGGSSRVEADSGPVRETAPCVRPQGSGKEGYEGT